MKTVLPGLSCSGKQRVLIKLVIVTYGLFILVANGIAADVETTYIGKGRVYAQTNAGTPVLKSYPYIFEAAVRAATPLTGTALTDATWSEPPFPVPPGAWQFIPPPSARSALWSWIERSTSQSTVDSAHPDGDYYIKLNTVHDGLRTNRVVLSGSTYPPAPQIANYAAAQNIDPSSDFTLQWNPIAGGRETDLITFTVLNSTNRTGIVFQTPTSPDAPSALDGTQTSVTLPTGTLLAGRVYVARLRYQRIVNVDRTSYPGELGYAAYFASTDFYLATVSADSNTAPRVIAIYPASGAVDVPTDAPLIWTFNKPMLRASGFFHTHVTDHTSFWTTDRRSFVVVPVTGHSTNVTITYQLQPWGPSVLFGDPLGNPLFTDVNSQFQTADKRLLPAKQPRLDPPTVVTNTARMLLHGESNRVYTIQFSTDLANWTTFSTNVTLTGPSPVTHPAVSSAPQRFYRAMVLQ
jgi:hypothetical protein